MSGGVALIVTLVSAQSQSVSKPLSDPTSTIRALLKYILVTILVFLFLLSDLTRIKSKNLTDKSYASPCMASNSPALHERSVVNIRQAVMNTCVPFLL